jgi:hypothetical protein
MLTSNLKSEINNIESKTTLDSLSERERERERVSLPEPDQNFKDLYSKVLFEKDHLKFELEKSKQEIKFYVSNLKNYEDFIFKLDEVKKRYADREEQIKINYNIEITELKKLLYEANNQQNNQKNDSNSERNKLLEEIKHYKTVIEMNDRESDRLIFREYKDKCIRLEKSVMDYEHVIALKSNEITKLQTDYEKLERKYKSLEYRMELGIRNEFPKSSHVDLYINDNKPNTNNTNSIQASKESNSAHVPETFAVKSTMKRGLSISLIKSNNPKSKKTVEKK